MPVIQFEKDGAEDAGLVKIDLLGNRSLAVIRDAIAAVHGNTGRLIDYTSTDAGEDPATRALFRTGQTMGVFYTESPASRALCAKSRAETFDLLVLNTSIIRPASNRYIRTYLERLHGAPYEPLDPVLRDTLAETFGVMVYQEDVVNVCSVFAGMPLATADGLRKSLSKKRPAKQLAGYAQEFFAGALALGRDAETIKRVWDMVMSFAGYSFCKGHSASYIQVAQHSCYLRAHYPAEFMAAVLANGGGFYHPFAYVAEAMRMGLTVLPPDVNAERAPLHRPGRELRIGLQFVKGLSAEGAERVLRERGRREVPLPLRPPLPHRRRIRRPPRPHQGRCARFDRGWMDPADDAVDGGCGTAPGLGRPGCQRRIRHRDRPHGGAGGPDWFDHLPPAVPVLKDYPPSGGGGRSTRRWASSPTPIRCGSTPTRSPLQALPQRRPAPPCGRACPARPACSPPPSRSTPSRTSRWSSPPSTTERD